MTTNRLLGASTGSDASHAVIDNTTQIVINDARSGVERFRAWYTPHAEEIMRKWHEKHDQLIDEAMNG